MYLYIYREKGRKDFLKMNWKYQHMYQTQDNGRL